MLSNASLCQVQAVMPGLLLNLTLLGHGLLETSAGLLNILPRGKGRKTKVSLSSRAESSTRNGHNLSLFEDFTECIPRRLPIGKLNEHIRSIGTTKNLVADGLHGILEKLGIFQVVINERINLFHTLLIEASKTAGLDNIGCAIESSGHNTVEIIADGSTVTKLEIRGHNSPAKTDTGETSILGERVALNSNLLGTLNLVNGLGNARGANEGGICGIKDTIASSPNQGVSTHI